MLLKLGPGTRRAIADFEVEFIDMEEMHQHAAHICSFHLLKEASGGAKSLHGSVFPGQC